MTAPSPDRRPRVPEPPPHPDPKPVDPNETPVRIIELPPSQPSPGIPMESPPPS